MKRIETDRESQLFVAKNILLWWLIMIYSDIRISNGWLYFIEQIIRTFMVVSSINIWNSIIFTRNKQD